MDPLAASLARSPELFPLDFDAATDQVALIPLTEADYERASFLDGRILTPHTLRRTVSWRQLEAAVAEAGLEESAGYIFHIGHVGSTLLSRLLGTHCQVFGLREPAILRTLTQMHSPSATRAGWASTNRESRLDTALKLLARTFRQEQRAIVKATSFVSELATQILARGSLPKAVFMYVPAGTYLATILGAPNSPEEVRLLAPSRLKRLHIHLGQERWNLADLSEGEMVAMSWACEMTTLGRAADAAPGQVLWLDFDVFLESPAGSLASAFRQFGIHASRTEIGTIAFGAQMHRYAKAPEHPYDPKLRAQILNQARRDRAVEFARGLAWLDRAANNSPAIGSALSRH